VNEALLIESCLTFGPPVIPRISRTEAQAINIIAAHGSHLDLTFPAIGHELEEKECSDSDLWVVSLSPETSSVVRDSCTVTQNLRWGGGHVRLHFPRETVLAWMNAQLPVAAIDTVNEEILTVALETLITHVFSELDRTSRCGIPVFLDHDVEACTHAWLLSMRHFRSGSISFALLEVDTLGLMFLANVIKRAPVKNNALDDSSLRVTLQLDVGWTELNAIEVATLSPQDTIFLDHYSVSESGDMWLTIPGFGVRIRPQDGSYYVTHGWKSLMTTTPDIDGDFHDLHDGVQHSSSIEPEDTSFNVDDLPVRITFSLGERNVTLGDLRRLQLGAVFDLDKPLNSGPVSIRANGRLLGVGDLVSIDGRVGVAVRELGDA